jgi:hypothetical protein
VRRLFRRADLCGDGLAATAITTSAGGDGRPGRAAAPAAFSVVAIARRAVLDAVLGGRRISLVDVGPGGADFPLVADEITRLIGLLDHDSTEIAEDAKAELISPIYVEHAHSQLYDGRSASGRHCESSGRSCRHDSTTQSANLTICRLRLTAWRKRGTHRGRNTTCRTGPSEVFGCPIP